MNNLELTNIHVDICTALSTLQITMILNNQEETARRLEELRYIERILEHANNIIKKEMEACQDQK